MNIRDRNLLNERGQIAVIVALLIVVLIGMVAFVVDVGSLYEVRRHLQTVADAAALAGAQNLPENPDQAIQNAIYYASNNGVSITADNVYIDPAGTSVPYDTITVTPVDPNAPVYFAKVLGINSVTVKATATAKVNSPLGLSGLMPWMVLREDLKTGPSIDMKVGPLDKLDPGWFAAMEFGNINASGHGAKLYRWNIKTGCTEEIFIYSIVNEKSYPKEGGNMARPTDKEVDSRIAGDYCSFEDVTDVDNYGNIFVTNEDCPRIVLVPVTDSFTRLPNEPIQVTGFAIFYIEGSELEEEKGQEIGVVTGKFIDYMIINSSADVGDYRGGIKVIRLIK